MKSLIKNNIFYKIAQLFYGELFNRNNSIKTRFMRLACRTPIKTICYYVYKKIFKKENIQLEETDNFDQFENINDEKKILKDIKNTGLSLDINLKNEIVEKILQKITDKKFQVNRDKNRFIIFSQKKDDDIYLYRLHNPHTFVSEIDELSRNKKILNIVRKYLNTEPIIHSSQIWWTFPYFDQHGKMINPPGNEYGFHYDVDDFKFLKLFFYLSDVDVKSGPHMYIINDGKKNFKEFLNRRIENNFAEDLYNNRIVTITGKKGSGFIEDTSFYHRGSNPLSNSGRGVLQIIYSVSKW